MHKHFDEIAVSARVWIYQADKRLSDENTLKLQMTADQFTKQWAAHGKALASAAKIFYNQFLVLAVDETHHNASGCSIDSSVAFVKQAEVEFGINFFDRTKVAFILNDDIYVESLQNIKHKIAEGIIKRDTITFNNLVTTKGEMLENWKSEAGSTWLSKYFVAEQL